MTLGTTRGAAQLGRTEAQFFLGILYCLGRGVPENDQLAHVSCEIALAGGLAAGLDCRDAASSRMRRGGGRGEMAGAPGEPVRAMLRERRGPLPARLTRS
jgi:TPR repeat protein